MEDFFSIKTAIYIIAAIASVAGPFLLKWGHTLITSISNSFQAKTENEYLDQFIIMAEHVVHDVYTSFYKGMKVMHKEGTVGRDEAKKMAKKLATEALQGLIKGSGAIAKDALAEKAGMLIEKAIPKVKADSVAMRMVGKLANPLTASLPDSQ